MYRIPMVFAVSMAACLPAAAQTYDFKPLVVGVLDAPSGGMKAAVAWKRGSSFTF